MNTQSLPLRRVRSFVRRDGRITDGQKRVLTDLWPVFGMVLQNQPIDLAGCFGREAPTIVEIGFGSGHSLLEMARAHPEINFLGIETYQPGIGTLLLGVEAFGLQNIRVCYADAVEVMRTMIPASSLMGVQIFFPDPWPKRCHHKRRLIQSEFVALLVSCLRAGGVLHLATDWEHYAQHMMRVLSQHPELQNIAGEGVYAPRSERRPITTKFEERGHLSGRAIYELQFSRDAHFAGL